MDITIREWKSADKDGLIHMCNLIDRKYLSNNLPTPYNEQCAEWWFKTTGRNEGKNGVYRVILDGNKVIGSISVQRKDGVYCKDAEIGYMLLDEYSGKGIMTEAVKLIRDISFMQLDIIRITGLVYEPNVASSRVLEKNRFNLEGVMRNAVFKNENIYNLKIYSSIKEVEHI